mmetsp:Transcript_6013/g.18020  ORF Transcript_6013/g.18020 Transcript_6013/m.18020 type:complete len:319 (-) Transcript_6013:16-972(-)
MVRVPEGKSLLALDPDLFRVVVDDLHVGHVDARGLSGQLHEPIEGDSPVPDAVEKPAMGLVVLHGQGHHLRHVLDLGHVRGSHAVARDGHGPPPRNSVEKPLLAVLVVGIPGDVLGPEDALLDGGGPQVVLHGDVARALLDRITLHVRRGDARLVDPSGAHVKELLGSLPNSPVDDRLASVQVLAVVVHHNVVASRRASPAVRGGAPHRLHAHRPQLVEPAERLLVHLVASLVPGNHDRHIVVLLRELLGQVEPNHGVATSGRVHHKHTRVGPHIMLLLLMLPPQARRSGTQHDGWQTQRIRRPPGSPNLARGTTPRH